MRVQHAIEAIVVAIGILSLAFAPYVNSKQVPCLENGRFYVESRKDVRTPHDCSKYFLCVEGEVFEFRCTTGLHFDVGRQVCDLKPNLDDCAMSSETVQKPPLREIDCPNEDQLPCADRPCLPDHYFCDGSIDCQDGSDENNCGQMYDPYAASDCDPLTCTLPNCFCSKDGKGIPGNLNPNDVPQMILLTFDDAINNDNWDLYSRELFATERRNPNGCPISATFFVSHQYNNYHQTQKLWNVGHEIAIHSITHRGPEQWWSTNATLEDWFDEMIGQANILNRFSNIPMKEIRGLRVPFLQIGWNKQFLMMKEFGFVYDSSIMAPFSNPPLWPYTLDHKISHNCTGTSPFIRQNCPSRPYPGMWELVMNQVIAQEHICPMVESCPSTINGEQMYKILERNFKRHYLSNRAPYGLHFHADWFKNTDYLAAFQKFVTDMMQYPDVWFVTNFQAIQWMRNPVTVDQLNSFEAWNCKRRFHETEIACSEPNICHFDQGKYLYTCNKCPETYPWIKNEFGFQ